VIRLTPKIAKPYNDLGKAYILKGDMDDAMLMFSNAARLNPGLAQARWNLGNAWLRKGKVAEGLEEMKKGVELSPDDVEAHQRLGDTLIKLGKAAEAMPYCEMVVKTEPTNARARLTLGTAYLAQRQLAKATVEFKEAVRLAPASPPCLNSLAWVYATSPQAEFRDGAEAVRLAGQACVLTKGQDAGLLDTLAAAYAEAGRFEDAVKTAEEARTVANAAHDTKMAEMEQKQVELYRAGKPCRDK
jgi:tetratricopeptide (TPR) repeat protein